MNAIQIQQMKAALKEIDLPAITAADKKAFQGLINESRWPDTDEEIDAYDVILGEYWDAHEDAYEEWIKSERVARKESKVPFAYRGHQVKPCHDELGVVHGSGLH